jgi:hypothetical protein
MHNGYDKNGCPIRPEDKKIGVGTFLGGLLFVWMLCFIGVYYMMSLVQTNDHRLDKQLGKIDNDLTDEVNARIDLNGRVIGMQQQWLKDRNDIDTHGNLLHEHGRTLTQHLGRMQAMEKELERLRLVCVELKNRKVEPDSYTFPIIVPTLTLDFHTHLTKVENRPKEVWFVDPCPPRRR